MKPTTRRIGSHGRALAGAVALCLASQAGAFDTTAYRVFLAATQDIGTQPFLDRYPPAATCYSTLVADTSRDSAFYLDSVRMKLGLTPGELSLLRKNGFVVSERMSYPSFGGALADVWNKDLPVFVTTDAILHALHMSYDEMLRQLEVVEMRRNLSQALAGLRAAYPGLLAEYQATTGMLDALRDVDVYVTMALSLLEGTRLEPQFAAESTITKLWDAVQAESYASMPLYSEGARSLDFSQFKVRGHYESSQALRTYFKAMMWVGRMEFILTPLPYDVPNSREEVRRMCMGAVLLNELLDRASARSLIERNDTILRALIGESDNLTPAELSTLLPAAGISGAADLLNDSLFDRFETDVAGSRLAGQQILSAIMMTHPTDGSPDAPPASFLLLGQRFIIDSYVFCNVTFDEIVYEGRNVYRMLPDPLDAMFVLGNDDAGPLLRAELDAWHYGANLSSLRYLVDSYDNAFWQGSLYNSWLHAFRALNPNQSPQGLPLFAQTSAWRQLKLNTQLGSWTQLRHDNILYAKQSYTDGTWCSYPHSYVEPYPEFYRRIAAFAEGAAAKLAGFEFSQGDFYPFYGAGYLENLKCVMDTLAEIAAKELSATAFTDQERAFLQRMIAHNGICGAPPYDGWYAHLFVDAMTDIAGGDYLVADVHTQPTDAGGAMVGNVLHVGVGKVNLGVFVAPAPSAGFRPTAFVGPVYSYYEKLTSDFTRLTDTEWKQMVANGELPARPDWTNCYMADSTGLAVSGGRTLSGVAYSVAVRPSGRAGTIHMPGLTHRAAPDGGVLVNVSSGGPAQLSLFDGQGRVVVRSALCGPGTVHVGRSALARGAYVMRLTGVGGSVASCRLLAQ